ncbi:AAA family ATPase [Paenibacillus sp. CGMCC 1.16610]|uniref:AAA family ATPase n=1 Tax=Paenibacillus anseongense TaxID=2682845 RepID=A0ABW9UI21_9BACL|nr:MULTISPECIES: ATP-binding protein [Paenibacillus]MBA2939868.1 AAA family ATPase [Paenibacillus sp. CGMCC 1.16610]MVQ39528.1 AAA family ATPase [Paenibacillus anseongense]
MSQIKIKKFYLNEETQILFNDGENYIVGLTATGKTTLFNLIQFILGIRKNFNGIINNSQKPYITCEFTNNRLIKISRDFNSNEVVFTEGNTIKTVKVNSSELNEVYSSFMNPSTEHYKRSALDILNFSFLTAIDLGKSYFYKKKPLKSILGYNEEYLESIENDINKLKSGLEIEKQSLNLLDIYIENVRASLLSINGVVENPDQIIGILEMELTKVKKTYESNYELLQRSKEIYDHELTLYDEFFQGRILELQPYFQEVLNLIMPSFESKLNNLTLSDLINNKNINMNNTSMGEKIIIYFALHLTLCRSLSNEKFQNGGSGLLVTDELFIFNDNYSLKRIRNKINEVTKVGELQYIGFTQDSMQIPKENIVFSLPQNKGGSIFG